MDHLLYIAMSGAKESMNSLAVRSNNLANANTTGFKSDFEQARSMQAFGEGLPTRVFAMAERPGAEPAAWHADDHGSGILTLPSTVRAGLRCRIPRAAKPIPAWAICS